MKDTKQIKKILYLGSTNIALVVANVIEKEQNILFASQVNVDSENLQFKVLELLTNAANFLGFNIKDVEVIIDDPVITNYTYTEKQFYDCNCEDDIAKEIYKKARINNYYVNEINFLGITYDDIERVATANCQICASDYITYKKYINAVKACNVVITKTTNLYKLLKRNKDEIELTLKIENDKVIACEYYGKKLNNVKIVNLNLNDIKQHLCDKFNITLNKIDNVLVVANKLATSEDEINVVNNYDLKTKSFNNVKITDFLSLYRDEIRTQISNYVDFRNFHNVQIISKDLINKIDGFDFLENNEICLSDISLDKIACLHNIDMSQDEIDQFSFENKIKTTNLLA